MLLTPPLPLRSLLSVESGLERRPFECVRSLMMARLPFSSLSIYKGIIVQFHIAVTQLSLIRVNPFSSPL